MGFLHRSPELNTARYPHSLKSPNHVFITVTMTTTTVILNQTMIFPEGGTGIMIQAGNQTSVPVNLISRKYFLC